MSHGHWVYNELNFKSEEIANGDQPINLYGLVVIKWIHLTLWVVLSFKETTDVFVLGKKYYKKYMKYSKNSKGYFVTSIVHRNQMIIFIYIFYNFHI